MRTDWSAESDDTAAAVMDPPHHLEQTVSRTLREHPEMRFSSLVIRRLENGVCLEGVVEVDDDGPDVSTLVRTIEGVDRVINRLVVRHPGARKG